MQEHELAPHTNRPEPRGDLEALIRLNIDQIGAALGVPASLLFEGKFSGKSTQQLQLLNSTVSQLAKSINDVLTKTYNAIYPEEYIDVNGYRKRSSSGIVELKLRTAPISSSEELVSLFQSQLVDSEIAIPAALHTLGASTDQIEAAVERYKAKEKKQIAHEEEEREFQKKIRSIEIEERRGASSAVNSTNKQVQ